MTKADIVERIHQKIGFSKKENAMIIAKWNANELQQGKTKKIFINVEDARKLGVTDDDLKLEIPKTH